MKKSTPVPTTNSIYEQYLSRNFHYPANKNSNHQGHRTRDQRSCQKQKALSYSAIDKQLPKKEYHLWPTANNLSRSYKPNLIPIQCNIATVQQIQSAIKQQPNSNNCQNSFHDSPNVNQSIVRTELQKSLKQLSAIFSLQLRSDEQKTNRALQHIDNDLSGKNNDLTLNQSNQQAKNIIKEVKNKTLIKLSNYKIKFTNSIRYFEMSLNTLNKQSLDATKQTSMNLNQEGIFCVEDLLKIKNGKQIVKLLRQSAQLIIVYFKQLNNILEQMIQHAENTQFSQHNLIAIKSSFQKQELDLSANFRNIQVKEDKVIKLILQSISQINDLQASAKSNFNMTPYKVWKKALKKGIDLSLQACSMISNWLKWQRKIFQLASLASWSSIANITSKINISEKVQNPDNIDKLLFSEQKLFVKSNSKCEQQSLQNCYKSTPIRQERRRQQLVSANTNKSLETPCHFCMVLKNRIFQLQQNAKNDNQLQIQQESTIKKLQMKLQKMQRIFNLWNKTAGVQCNIIKFIENYDLREEFDRVNENRKEKKCLGSFYQKILLQQAKGIQNLIMNQTYFQGSLKSSLKSNGIQIQAVDTQPLVRELKPANLTIAKNTNKKITYFSGSFDRKNIKDIKSNDKLNSFDMQGVQNNKQNSNESNFMAHEKQMKKNNGTTVPNSRQNSSFLNRNIHFNQHATDQSDSNLLSYSPDVQQTSNKLRLPDRKITQEVLDYDISEFQLQRQIPKRIQHIIQQEDYYQNTQLIKQTKEQAEQNNIEKQFNMILLSKKNDQDIKHKIQQQLKRKLNEGELTLKIGQQYQYFIDNHLRTQLQRVKQQKKKINRHKRFTSQNQFMSLDKIRTTNYGNDKTIRRNSFIEHIHKTKPKEKSKSAPKFILFKH